MRSPRPLYAALDAFSFMTDGFDSPESAAMNGFPATHCSVITSRTQGEDAYVLLNTGSGAPYLYGVVCGRRNGQWFEQGSSNGPGWEQTAHDPDVGTLSFWGEAPAGADMVRVECGGEEIEELVTQGAYLLVWWRVRSPVDWPRITAFRLAGAWVRP
jgi:hypothetical protein